MDKKIGLVLSGGGSRGLAHIGALKELEKLNIKFSAIAGCSMGAIIGVLYASGKTAEEIDEFISSKKIIDFFDFSFSKLGIKKTKKLQKLIEEFIGFKTFQKLKIPLYINATNLSQGREVVFSSGNIFTAIRATIAVPGVFAPVQKGNDYYIDGGVLNQNPFSILPPQIDKYIIINASPYQGLKGYKKIDAMTLLDASLKLMQNEILKLKLEKLAENKKYVLVEPSLGNYSLIEFRSKEREIINKGAKAIRDNLSKIKNIVK
jgi:NTE family protein